MATGTNMLSAEKTTLPFQPDPFQLLQMPLGTFIKDPEILDVLSPHSEDRDQKNLAYLLQLRRGSSQWNKWAYRVVELRAQFKSAQNVALATHREVRTAITIAERCFDDRWALPVVAILIALKPRTDNDTIIRIAFHPSEEVQSISLQDIKIDGDRLPEVKQSQSMLNDVHRRFSGRDIGLLNNPFKNGTSLNG
ncbi:hypothetical protein BDY21DRAFT_386020 [Lineolata rhizophorae]|uniref:Uncharacterized protein n=1 Tax=Lineolata rhizophorae TaxID=578093 RepID=A0A6A6P0A0_9PEZI|nr:hypothetical protein BDY21DRAFT_386020 [Lineolata rhizophorae]